ncbi:helix-turn-helix domain-containing protein [Streptomyces phaeochromogenes]|uniref:helix-turn-helix domain-containing protein n=1 Tax=Streptomyces phaeochromogenes TaxID=1923 RepID=UPI0037162080
MPRTSPGPRPAAPASRGDEILTEIARDLQDAARDLARLLPSDDGAQPLRRIAQMQEQLDGLSAVAVGRARYRRVTWATISSILHINEDTARHRYNERYILRRLARFARSGTVPASLSGLFGTTASKGPEPPGVPGAAAESPDASDGLPCESTTPSEPSGTAYNRLAPILSMLIRTAQLSNKEVSTRIGCSPSFLSRILTGERVPTWELTQKFAQACGADPEVLRAVWESEKLSQKSRDATIPDTTDTLMPAAERLRTAVQTLHIRAGRPAPHDIAVASRWSLGAAAVASLLEAASLPNESTLTAFVSLLGGNIDYFEHLLHSALLEAEQGPEPRKTPPKPTSATPEWTWHDSGGAFGQVQRIGSLSAELRHRHQTEAPWTQRRTPRA